MIEQLYNVYVSFLLFLTFSCYCFCCFFQFFHKETRPRWGYFSNNLYVSVINNSSFPFLIKTLFSKIALNETYILPTDSEISAQNTSTM